MAEFVPLALACGHVAKGWQEFDLPDDGPATVRCEECLEYVRFVIEPAVGPQASDAPTGPDARERKEGHKP